MCQVKSQTVSATHPNKCPHCFPSLMETQDGNRYFKELWCHATDCPVCRSVRLESKIQKVKDGLARSERWQHTILDCDQKDFASKRRSLLDALNRLGWMYAAVTVKADRNRLHVIHEPIPGASQVGAAIRGRKKTLLAISRIIRADSSLSVRFARASKSRPCWTKNTVEKRRAADKRLPHEKHRLVVSSPYGSQRFQKLAVDQIGRRIESGDKLNPRDADSLFVLNRTSSRSKTDCGSPPSPEARFNISERDEKRLERESWYDSGPE